MKLYLRNEIVTDIRDDVLNNNGNNIQSILSSYIKKMVYVNNVISNDDKNAIETNQTPPLLSSMNTSGTKITDTITITQPQPRGYGIVGNRLFQKSDNYEISTVYLVDDTDQNNIKVYGYMDIPKSAKAIGQVIFDETLTFILRVIYIPSYSQAGNLLSNIPYLVTSTFRENVVRIKDYDEISHSFVSSYLTKLTGQTPVYIVTQYEQY